MEYRIIYDYNLSKLITQYNYIKKLFPKHSLCVYKNYKIGDIVECKVLSIDVEKERISLGMKQLTEELVENNDLDEFKKGMITTCNVTAVREDAIEVNINDQLSGIIKKSDLSSDKVDQKPERFAVGDRIDAKIISIDKLSRKAALSIKALEIEEREKAIKEYGSADSGASLGDILGVALGKDH
jgi:small subunit ribosomal protein S1